MEATDAIDYHRTWLLRLLTSLFALAGIEPGGAPVARLPKSVRLSILRILLPAESATRRLAAYLFERMTEAERADALAKTPPKKTGKKTKRDGAKGRSKPAPVFWLFDKRLYDPLTADPHKRLPPGGPGPRISFFDERDAPREPIVAKPARDPDDALRLCRRMEALLRALNDMPEQARRLARAMEKRAQAPESEKRGPIRKGAPPGYRPERNEEVDTLLYECHLMTQPRTPPPDTS